MYSRKVKDLIFFKVFPERNLTCFLNESKGGKIQEKCMNWWKLSKDSTFYTSANELMG
jgi:hypothetical protein